MFTHHEAVMEASYYYHLFARASYASYKKTGQHLAFDSCTYQSVLNDRFDTETSTLILIELQHLVNLTANRRYE